MNSPSQPLALLGFRPGAGGIPRVMLDLIEGLHRAGIAVDLLLPPGDYPDLGRLATAAPRTVALTGGNPRQARAELADYLRQERPAAVLSNKDRTSTLLAELREADASLARPPTWLRIGSDVREKIRRKPLWRRRAYRQRLIANYRAADGLIANSDGVAESLTELLGDPAQGPCPEIRTIANPLDLSRVESLAAAPAPHPWLADDGPPVVLGIGRLVAVKDFPTLIRGFARLQTDVQSRLLIFGEGRQRASLERLIRRLRLNDRVDLPGFIENPFAALARAALFVLSSRYEGSPNVLIEALACGTACVSTDCRSGPRDILGQGRFGALIKVGDAQALAGAMSATLRSPPAGATLISAAQRFELGASVSAYLDALGLGRGDAGDE